MAFIRCSHIRKVMGMRASVDGHHKVKDMLMSCSLATHREGVGMAVLMAFIRCPHIGKVMGMEASADGLHKVSTHREGDGDGSQS